MRTQQTVTGGHTLAQAAGCMLLSDPMPAHALREAALSVGSGQLIGGLMNDPPSPILQYRATESGVWFINPDGTLYRGYQWNLLSNGAAGEDGYSAMVKDPNVFFQWARFYPPTSDDAKGIHNALRDRGILPTRKVRDLDADEADASTRSLRDLNGIDHTTRVHLNRFADGEERFVFAETVRLTADEAAQGSAYDGTLAVTDRKLIFRAFEDGGDHAAIPRTDIEAVTVRGVPNGDEESITVEVSRGAPFVFLAAPDVADAVKAALRNG